MCLWRLVHKAIASLEFRLCIINIFSCLVLLYDVPAVHFITWLWFVQNQRLRSQFQWSWGLLSSPKQYCYSLGCKFLLFDFAVMANGTWWPRKALAPPHWTQSLDPEVRLLEKLKWVSGLLGCWRKINITVTQLRLFLPHCERLLEVTEGGNRESFRSNEPVFLFPPELICFSLCFQRPSTV